MGMMVVVVIGGVIFVGMSMVNKDYVVEKQDGQDIEDFIKDIGKEFDKGNIIFSFYFFVEKVLLVVVLVVFYKEDGEIDYERYFIERVVCRYLVKNWIISII